MLRIDSLALGIHHTQEEFHKKVAAKLGCRERDLQEIHVVRRSIDARKKPDIFYSYTLDVKVLEEEKIIKRHRGTGIHKAKPLVYHPGGPGQRPLKRPPVIAGFGPGGIFAGLLLARGGFCPVILEQGEDVDSRSKTVETFWEKGILREDSNVSFGEGGAGTFSDGKLNTLVKDPAGRASFVLRTLVEFGAPEDILYEQKPHIGTDLLKDVVKNIRKEIIRLGGEIRFETKLAEVCHNRGKLEQVRILGKSGEEVIPADVLILAIGHSARDTFQMLYERGIAMESKAFALGLRVMHPQKMIDLAQYGEKEYQNLPPASYKLTARVLERGVYSFCMCPGGYVVNASTQKNHLTINGMSYHKRDSGVANSAIIVTVDQKDFARETGLPASHPLLGIYYQEILEKRAFALGKGSIPIQRLEDFLKGRESRDLRDLPLGIKGRVTPARVDSLLPEELTRAIAAAFETFDKKIPGFAGRDAYIAALESRTSSPLRIPRNKETLQANIAGIYPCGEGAGFAGGITSAAMDGLKIAEVLLRTYIYDGADPSAAGLP